jgi:hypothetical protein
LRLRVGGAHREANASRWKAQPRSNLVAALKAVTRNRGCVTSDGPALVQSEASFTEDPVAVAAHALSSATV